MSETIMFGLDGSLIRITNCSPYKRENQRLTSEIRKIDIIRDTIEKVIKKKKARNRNIDILLKLIEEGNVSFNSYKEKSLKINELISEEMDNNELIREFEENDKKCERNICLLESIIRNNAKKMYKIRNVLKLHKKQLYENIIEN